MNFLSLVNIIFSFIFTLLFAKIYGIGHVADTYFYALMIFMNIQILTQIFYSTFFNFYFHTKDMKRKKNLYYMLIIILIFISLIIISLFFLISNSFNLFNNTTREFLNIYIFSLLFIPIINMSILLMNAEKKFFYAYYYPIFKNIIALIIMLIYNEPTKLLSLAYGFLIFDFLFTLFIIYKSYNLLGKVKLFLDIELLIKLIKKSFFDKLGHLALSLPELIVANLLVSYFSGILALYSYIKKFTTAILQFIFMPQSTVTASRVGILISRYKYIGIKIEIKKLLSKTLPFFITANIFLVFTIIFILELFISAELVSKYQSEIYLILFILILQNVLTIFEYPYGSILHQKLMFEYTLKVKIISLFLFLLGYLVFINLNSKDLLTLLLINSIPALIMLILYRKRANKILRNYE